MPRISLIHSKWRQQEAIFPPKFNLKLEQKERQKQELKLKLKLKKWPQTIEKRRGPIN